MPHTYNPVTVFALIDMAILRKSQPLKNMPLETIVNKTLTNPVKLLFNWTQVQISKNFSVNMF